MKTIKIAAILSALLAFTACSTQQEEDRTVIKEPDKTINVIENVTTAAEKPSISVEKIDKFEGMEITDWLDEQTVVMAKENKELGKMSLSEKADFYPRSIYLYNFDTKEYRTLKAQKNMFLGGATISPDKKHLLYHEYSIGDTAYFLMNVEDDTQVPVKEEVLGIAMTAEWADSQNVIGVSYAGGAYIADISREVTQIEELEGEQLFSVKKAQDKIYYITVNDSLQLNMLDMETKEKKNLNVKNVRKIIPSPDGKQILVLQATEAAIKLLVIDAEGNILRTIAEGTDVTGVSWSPNMSAIAYRFKTVIDGVDSSGLYIYDVLTNESVQIAVDIEGTKISWSPSGKKIAVTESDGRFYNSSVIYLK